MDRRLWIIVLALCWMPPAEAQIAISPRAGLVHHVEGRVSVDGEPLSAETNQFPQLDERQVLETDQGRAEVLLSPGTMLRAGKRTSLRILSGDITDVEVEILNGSALVDCRNLADGSQITVLSGDSAVRIEDRGSFRVDASGGDSRVRVYRGRITVTREDSERRLKARRALDTSTQPPTTRTFDLSEKDALEEWGRERVEAVAKLNEITPHTNSELVSALSFLMKHSQSKPSRPAVHRGRPYGGAVIRRRK